MNEHVQIAAAAGAPALLGAIDRAHLSRMTLGDRALEREVLQLFERQVTMLMARMQDAPPSLAAALAHTLKGSASGIGAVRVGHAAEAVELAAATAAAPALPAALRALAAAADEARAAIADLLRAH